MKAKDVAKKFWHIYWEDNSLLSYIVFFVVTYLVLKFVAFPVFLFATGLSDVTAVMTESMVHYKDINQTYYTWMLEHNFTMDEIEKFPFKNGLNVGDVVFVKRLKSPDEIKLGGVIVFYGPRGYSIIHRVVKIEGDTFTTKGDANPRSAYYETNIKFEDIKGKAIFKIPYLGYPRVLLGKLGI